jgi:hypothetical protein
MQRIATLALATPSGGGIHSITALSMAIGSNPLYATMKSMRAVPGSRRSQFLDKSPR